MSKHVTITNNGYIDSLPIAPNNAVIPGSRGAVMRQVLELAAKNGWDVRVAGQKWERS